jgi:hypothetical protein
LSVNLFARVAEEGKKKEKEDDDINLLEVL